MTATNQQKPMIIGNKVDMHSSSHNAYSLLFTTAPIGSSVGVWLPHRQLSVIYKTTPKCRPSLTALAVMMPYAGGTTLSKEA